MAEIALVMIVKNEAPTLALTLESARAALGHGPTVIVDTGSTDDTIGVVERWAAQGYRPTKIYQRPFDDFSRSRNAALALAWKEAPSACMVDAGVVVRGTYRRHAYPATQVPSPETAEIRLGSLLYVRPQILVPGWGYYGKVHEYAAGPGALRPSGLTFAYELKDEERGRRWVRDLALLEDDFSPRGRFYYAQTLDLLGRRTQALKAYLERFEIHDTGYWQERVIAMIRAIPLAATWEDAEIYAQAALGLDGSRGEAWLALCAWAERAQKWATLYHYASQAIACVPRHGALFVDVDREWRANVYAGDALSSRGEYAAARAYWARALEVHGGRMSESDQAELRLGLEITL